MSTISAGLVNVETLTVTGTQPSAVNATTLTTQNLSVTNINVGDSSLTNALVVLNAKLDSLLTTMELVPDANLEIATKMKFAGFNHIVNITVPPTYNPNSTDLFPTILYVTGLGEMKLPMFAGTPSYTDSSGKFIPTVYSSCLLRQNSVPLAYTSKRGRFYNDTSGQTIEWSKFIIINVSYANEVIDLLNSGVYNIPTEQSMIESVMDELLPRLNVDMTKLFFMGFSTGGAGFYDHLMPGRSTTEFDKIITLSSAPMTRFSPTDHPPTSYGSGYWNYQDVGSVGVDTSGNEFPAYMNLMFGALVPYDFKGLPVFNVANTKFGGKFYLRGTGYDSSGYTYDNFNNIYNSVGSKIYDSSGKIYETQISFENSIYYKQLNAVLHYKPITLLTGQTTDSSGYIYGKTIKLRAFLSKTDNIYSSVSLEKAIAMVNSYGADAKYIPGWGNHGADTTAVFNLTKYALVVGQPDMTVPEYLLSNF
jgi:hypothetical protein